MKGVVFNMLEEAVIREFGPDTWDDLLDASGLAGSYTSLGNYDDAEIVALVGAAAKALNLTNSQVLRWFGEKAMPIMKERYGVFFEKHNSSKSFVLSVNSMIHPEVRKLYSGASCPFFHFREAADGSVTMDYDSERRMCDLADGFVRGAAGLYCEEVDVVHQACMNHGDAKCVLEMRWAA